jgi:tetratricopeptide (TPR) repeat protein
MRKRLVIGSVAGLLLVLAGAAAALYFSGRRDVTTSSDQAYRLYRDAMENERRFYFREAREGFARALELDPQFAEAMLGLARQTQGDQGLALIKRAEKEKPHLNERERLHVAMQLAGREGRLDEQIRIAKEIHEKHPEDGRAAMALAGAEVRAGNSEKALQIFRDLLAVEPNNAEAYNQIGYLFAYRGDTDGAVENLRKYQFMAPDQANPYDSLGEILAYAGRYDEAIANLEEALKRKPDFFESYRHLGVAYEGKGEWAKAIASYRKAAETTFLDEMRRDLLWAAQRVAIRTKDAATAKELFGEMAKLPNDRYADVRNVGEQAVLAYLDGRYAASEALLRDLTPKVQAVWAKEKTESDRKFYDPGLSYMMARVLVAENKFDQALPLLEEMASPPRIWSNFEERRAVYEGRALLAELLARRGDLDRAEKLLAENRRWNPSWAPTRSSEEVVAALQREKVLAASR